MQLYPALDLRGGRLARAAPDTDPAVVLAHWRAAGATWVHVVDLDRVEGTGSNTPLISALMTAGGVAMQLGGGLTGEAARRELDRGVTRVVVGSAGVAGVGDLIARYGTDRVGVALDLRGGTAWMPGGDAVGDPRPLFRRAVEAGVRHVVVRDLTRDGTLAGARLSHLDAFRHPGVDLIVAGGVATLDDIAAARAAGAAGVIVGRALLDGRFSFAEALACCG